MRKVFAKEDINLRTNEKFTRNFTPKEITNNFLTGLKNSWKRFNFVYIFIAIFLIYLFSSISNFNWMMVTNIFYSSVTVGIVAIGMGLIILTGEIDLSVGSIFAFIGGLSVLSYNYLLNSTGSDILAILLTLLIALGLGLFSGFINGIFIGKLKMPGFIVTLATMLIFRSIIQYILSIQEGKPSTFRINGYGTDSWFSLGNEKFLTIHIVSLLFVLVAILVFLVTKYTKYGRKIYAVGSNNKAASLVGINSGWTKVSVFMIAGALIGFASFLQLGIRGSIDPATTGKSYELYAIAAVVLGGISMSGGKGSMIGVIFGTLAFQTIDKIIAALRLNANLNDTIKGAILIIAVLINVLKITKEDVEKLLYTLKLKLPPDLNLNLQSEMETKIEILERKYAKKIDKVNSLNLPDQDIIFKIKELLKEKNSKIVSLKKEYEIKIAKAEIKIALAEEKKNKAKKINNLEKRIENSKLYIKAKVNEVKEASKPLKTLYLEKELELTKNIYPLIKEDLNELYNEKLDNKKYLDISSKEAKLENNNEKYESLKTKLEEQEKNLLSEKENKIIQLDAEYQKILKEDEEQLKLVKDSEKEQVNEFLNAEKNTLEKEKINIKVHKDFKAKKKDDEKRQKRLLQALKELEKGE